MQRTFYLLEEREITAYNTHGWLHSEALSGTGVQEWGTFRKALWKRIYSAVVPILAEIIAFADRDRNLDLMKGGNIWVSTLWLKIMVDPKISELSYSKMISPVTNSVRERVQVIGSGAGGHSFQCLFPFSFIVNQRVDKMLKDAFSVTGNSQLCTLRAINYSSVPLIAFPRLTKNVPLQLIVFKIVFNLIHSTAMHELFVSHCRDLRYHYTRELLELNLAIDFTNKYTLSPRIA